MFYFSVQLLPEIFLNLRRLSANITINVGTFQVKYPLFLSEINETWIFSTDLRKNTEIPSFMKIRPVGAEFFHADRTDGRIERHDEANSRKTLLCCHKSTHRWGKYLIPTLFFLFIYKGPTNIGSIRQPDNYSTTPDLNQQDKPHLHTAIYYSTLAFVRVTRTPTLSPVCCVASVHQYYIYRFDQPRGLMVRVSNY